MSSVMPSEPKGSLTVSSSEKSVGAVSARGHEVRGTFDEDSLPDLKFDSTAAC